MAKQVKADKNFRIDGFFSLLEKAEAELPPFVLACGPNDWLRAQAMARLTQAWTDRTQGDIVKPADMKELSGELSGTGLFAADKLVLVRRGEEVFGFAKAEGGSAAGRNETPIIDRLENPAAGIWVFIESASVPANRTLGKKLLEHCVCLPCEVPQPRDAADWLETKAREQGKTLSADVADMLVRAWGTDMARLSSEVDKLVLYAGDSPTIDVDMAADFFTGDIVFDSFKFSNAVAARNRKEAVFYARRIAIQGLDGVGRPGDAEGAANMVLSGVGSMLAAMLRAGVAKAQGQSPEVFASAAKLNPWRAKRLMEDAGRFTLRELRTMTAWTADALRASHDTGSDVLLGLEQLAVKLTGRPE